MKGLLSAIATHTVAILVGFSIACANVCLTRRHSSDGIKVPKPQNRANRILAPSQALPWLYGYRR